MRPSIALVVIALASVPAPTRPDFTAARQRIRAVMARDSLPGLTIAVVRGDSILWEEGFGWADREKRVPATPETPFYLASLSKTITATALMILREQGRLDIDRPTNDYLHGSKLWSPGYDASAATVRRVMNHTAGLTTYDAGCPAQLPHCKVLTFDETLARYGVLVWPPGGRFDYSNLGYLILGHVVANAAGQDFGAFLREQIFRPLGMQRSSLGVDPALEPQTAVQYHPVYGPLENFHAIPSGASTIYSSAHDLARFAQLHLKTHPAGARGILSDAAIDTMQSFTVSADGGQRYGLGWWIQDDRYGYRSLLAQGGNPSSSAWLRILPSERIAVAVLANQGVGSPGDVIDAVLDAMLPRYATLRAAPPSPSVASNAPAKTTLDTAFVGNWSGYARWEGRDLSLAFSISDSGAARGTVAAHPTAGRARLGRTLFVITVGGDLETADTTGGRRVSFYLLPRDGRLSGTVTTPAPSASSLQGRVSYWVELKKQ
jgi:CubicO group peptidase (beta-lactamase class C family)